MGGTNTRNRNSVPIPGWVGIRCLSHHDHHRGRPQVMEPIAAGRPGRPPGIRTHADGLTTRQSHIVRAIREFVARTGYPPSMRQIGAAVGLSSTSSVAHQLSALEKKGAIRKDPRRPRAYSVPPRADRRGGQHGGASGHRARPAYRADRRRRPDHRRAGGGRRPSAAPPTRRGWRAVRPGGRRRLDGGRRHLRRRLGHDPPPARCDQRRHRSLLAGSTVVQRDPMKIGAAQQQCGGRYRAQQMWRYHPIR